MGHLGVVLYEYLGEEYPEVLGSILGALKAIVNVIGMTRMTPPIKDLLPRLTPILKNRFVGFPLYVCHLSITTTPVLRLSGFCLGRPDELVPERYNREGKTSLDLLEQELVSGCGIKWAI